MAEHIVVKGGTTDARSGTTPGSKRQGLVKAVKNRGTTARSGTGKR